ncbi:hypothetical protein QN277_022129 [Acacia crassicarpa]|uniref:Uncharacterized protein n=1 Tax=Acacia crassicarpa TaxID=499986 RepID=A0AAE1JEB3_9FABA|nr:hypothetical protein QN277_022129 [Acacia crassicarpa]
MGRAPCCAKVGLHRGPWTLKEDALLTKYIQAHGEGQWRSLPKRAGLLRCGKSCRLRWMNYLRPDIKRGNITPEEDDLIIRMHSLLGNRWSLIAGRLPGRTDNEIKNHWNTHLSKRLRNQGTDPSTHKKLSSLPSSLPNSRTKKANKKKKKGKARDNNGVAAEKDEEKKTIVYLPKPVRVTACISSPIPRSDSNKNLNSFDSNSASGSTSQEKEEGKVPWGENYNYNNNNNNNFTYVDENDHEFVGLLEEDNDLVNGSDMEGQSEFPTSAEQHGTLEKLYEEYFQLLNNQQNQDELESFAESLLV